MKKENLGHIALVRFADGDKDRLLAAVAAQRGHCAEEEEEEEGEEDEE